MRRIDRTKIKENPGMTLKEITNLIHFGYSTLKEWWKKYSFR